MALFSARAEGAKLSLIAIAQKETKMRRVATAIILTLVLSVSAAEAGWVTFWSDDLEAGLADWTADPNWTLVNSASGAHSGSKRVQAVGPSSPGGDSLTKMIPTVGFGNLLLEVWVRPNGLEAGDLVYLEWTKDGGGSWTTLDTFDHNRLEAWRWEGYSLPAEANEQIGFGFRFRAELSSGSDAFSVDDILLTAIPEPATLLLLVLGSLRVCRRRH